jgi:hypothetical protein
MHQLPARMFRRGLLSVGTIGSKSHALFHTDGGQVRLVFLRNSDLLDSSTSIGALDGSVIEFEQNRGGVFDIRGYALTSERNANALPISPTQRVIKLVQNLGVPRTLVFPTAVVVSDDKEVTHRHSNRMRPMLNSHPLEMCSTHAETFAEP